MKNNANSFLIFLSLLLLVSCMGCTGNSNQNATESTATEEAGSQGLQEGAEEPMGAEEVMGQHDPRVTGIEVKKAVVQVATVKRDGGTCAPEDGCIHLCIGQHGDGMVQYNYDFEVVNNSASSLDITNIVIILIDTEVNKHTLSSCPSNFSETTIPRGGSANFSLDFCNDETVGWDYTAVRIKIVHNGTFKLFNLNPCADSDISG